VTDPLVTLPLYGDLFYKLGLLGLGGAVIAVIMIPLLKKLSEKHQQQNDPTSSQAAEVVA